MDRRASAVLTGIHAGRSTPWMPKLWAQLLLSAPPDLGPLRRDEVTVLVRVAIGGIEALGPFG
jgi:hypothetical protein